MPIPQFIFGNRYKGGIPHLLCEDGMLGRYQNEEMELSGPIPTSIDTPFKPGKYKMAPVNLAEFPHGKLLAVKDHIEFYAVPEGTYVLAIYERWNSFTLAEVEGWSVHKNRKVEIVTLANGCQIITDDDVRAIYGFDSETSQWVRRRPNEAFNVLVPYTEKCEDMSKFEPVRSLAMRIRLTEKEFHYTHPPEDPAHSIKPSKKKDEPVKDEKDESVINLIPDPAGGTPIYEVFRPVHLNTKLLNVIGVLAAHTSSKFDLSTCTIELYNFPVILLPMLSDLAIGKEKPHIHVDYDNDKDSKYAPKVTIRLFPWSAKFLHFACYKTEKYPDRSYFGMPGWVFNVDTEMKLAYISGFVYGCQDRYFRKHPNGKGMLLRLSHPILRNLHDIYYILRMRGSVSSISAQSSKDGWQLEIDQREKELLKCLNLLNGGGGRPFEKIPKQILRSFLRHRIRYASLVPFPKSLAKELKLRIKQTSNRQLYNAIIYYQDKGYMPKHIAAEIVEFLAHHSRIIVNDEFFDTWKALIESWALDFTKVKYVEKTNIEHTGYDLTVPHHDTFVGADGVTMSNTMNFHVPVSDEAVKEAIEKLMPSKNLMSATTFGPNFVPRHEYLHGLFLAGYRLQSRREADISRSFGQCFGYHALPDIILHRHASRPKHRNI